MELDLHEFDDEVWQAPQLRVSMGAYERACRDFGGSQGKSEEQKKTVIESLYAAVVASDLDRIKVLVKVLEVIYGLPRDEVPDLLVAFQAKRQAA